MDKNQELPSMEERIARVKKEESEISEDKIKENNRLIHVESRKYFLLFCLLLVVSGGIGYLVGAGAKVLERGMDSMADFWEQAAKVAAIAAPCANFALNLIGFFIGIMLLMKAKKLLKAYDGEEDTAERKINYILNWVMLVSQVLFIENMFLFAATCHYGIKRDTIFDNPYVANALPLIGIANIAIGLVIIMVLQYKTVEYVRLISPEKKGNIFDFRFQNKLEQSLDEAELMTTRKAGYKAYKCTSMVLLAMWIVCIVADLTFDAGLFPMAVIMFVLLVHICTYVFEVIRLER